MPATIQVILQEDVRNVGKSGELVRVRPGFARNFLLPRDLAVPATTAAVNRIAHEKGVAVARAEKLKKEAGASAAKLEGLVVQITHSAGEENRLFGSVTTKDIQAALKAKGVEVDRKKMHLAEPIKHLGTYDVPVKLLGDITATLKVEVISTDGRRVEPKAKPEPAKPEPAKQEAVKADKPEPRKPAAKQAEATPPAVEAAPKAPKDAKKPAKKDK